MGRLPKQASLIPLAPRNYSGTFTAKERNCLAWHVLSNCPQVEAFTMFLHPELFASPQVAMRMSREFFGTKDANDFITKYAALINGLGRPVPEAQSEEAPKPKPVQKPRLDGESDDDYKKRRKREAAESIVEKIIERVDEVEDVDELLDTIKAMKDTKFFEDDSVAQMPPLRYLPATCGECEYKRFIDEQIKLGNVKKI